MKMIEKLCESCGRSFRVSDKSSQRFHSAWCESSFIKEHGSEDEVNKRRKDNQRFTLLRTPKDSALNLRNRN